MANKRPLISKTGRTEEITSADVLLSEKANFGTSLVIPNTQTTPGTGGFQIKTATGEVQVDFGSGWQTVATIDTAYFKAPAANKTALDLLISDVTGTVRQTLDTMVLWTWDGAAWNPAGAIITGLYANYAALTATNGEFDGEIRIDLGTHSSYMWNQGTTAWVASGGSQIVDSTGTANQGAKVAYFSQTFTGYTAGTGIVFDYSTITPAVNNILHVEATINCDTTVTLAGSTGLYNVTPIHIIDTAATDIIIRIMVQYSDADEIFHAEVDDTSVNAFENGSFIDSVTLKVIYD